MGGCTGSTAGGIKMFRLFVLLEALKAQIRRQMFPNGVFGLHYNRQPIAPAIVTAVVTYAFAYLMTFSLLALGLSLTGLTFEESLGASATSLAGVGPGLGSANRAVLHVRGRLRCREMAADLRYAGRAAGDPAADPAVHAGVLACLSGGKPFPAVNPVLRRRSWIRRPPKPSRVGPRNYCSAAPSGPILTQAGSPAISTSQPQANAKAGSTSNNSTAVTPSPGQSMAAPTKGRLERGHTKRMSR